MPYKDPQKRKAQQKQWNEKQSTSSKPCSKCKTKPRRKSGSWCAECTRENSKDYYQKKGKNKPYDPVLARERYLWRTYGLTIAQVDSLLLSQGGCKICGVSEPGGQGFWHVDHDHSTGKVRGVLCHSCNVGLGCFKDDESLLAQAMDYLRESRHG